MWWPRRATPDNHRVSATGGRDDVDEDIDDDGEIGLRRQALGLFVRDLRCAAGVSQETIARRIAYSRARISDAETAHASLPAGDFWRRLDEALDAGGAIMGRYDEIVALRTARLQRRRERAVQERDARLARAAAPRPGGVGEVGPDRREFLGLGALSLAALADEERILGRGQLDATLDELESDVDDISRRYGACPYEELAPFVASRWQELGSMLHGYLPPSVQPRAVELRGQYSYFLGRLAFNVEDMRAARRFAGLAARYAEEVGEPVLLLSVAALRSSIAYWTQRWSEALAALDRVSVRHPYMDSRIAAYRARALARLDDPQGAARALRDMERASRPWEPRPGSTPVAAAGVAMYHADAALAVGDIPAAREWAPVAVAQYQARGGDYSVEEEQHARLNLALTFILSPRPEPEAAAQTAVAALAAGPSTPTHTVLTKLDRLGDVLGSRYEHLADVAAFTHARRALPSRSQP